MIDILTADIGGTNVRFEFHEYNLETKEKKLLKKEKLQAKDFTSLEGVISNFLEKIKRDSKRKLYGSLAIAGPVENNNYIKPTNLDWEGIDTNQLKKKFNFEGVYLLNDFEAVGNATNLFKEKKIMEEINKKSQKKDEGNNLIVGIGTGVGVCFVTRYFNNKGILKESVNPCEFAHSAMCVKNYFDYTFQRFVRFLLKIDDFKNLDMELLFSGTGIRNIYNFMIFVESYKLGEEKYQALLNGNLEKEFCEDKLDFSKFERIEITTEEIVTKFLAGEKVSKMTMMYFMELLGNAVFIFSAAFLPTRGTVFVGSLMKSLFENLKDREEKDLFSKIFLDNVSLEGHLKENFENLSYSVFMGDGDNIGLIGAFNFLLKKENLN